MSVMKSIRATEEMVKAATLLKEGELLIVYKDGNNIRAETQAGNNPYVWRNNKWTAMK